ncbi:carboxypeptidase-like regulatory domain-containing protein [Algibacter mikhailovii]|nr:carboxypeptidase-like regulatory domain-containing protein [Algibacter mikhailovii]
MKRELHVFVMLFFSLLSMAQTVEFHGTVVSDAHLDTENIHVINQTSQRYTTTNKDGHFKMVAKLNDTIMFSSIQFVPKSIVISTELMQSKILLVHLEEQINVLNEVLVGKVLTGDLLSDIQNTEGKAPINFYDVGIVGYTGKQATQSERRLHEATTGGGFMPLNPILNGISGRTKEIKEHVRIERKDALMRRIRSGLSDEFFVLNPLDEDVRMDYFYFCMDDKDFMNACNNKTDLEVLVFMEKKYVQYVQNRTQNKN